MNFHRSLSKEEVGLDSLNRRWFYLSLQRFIALAEEEVESKSKKYGSLEDIPGIGPATAAKLREMGFQTIESLATATLKDLLPAGIGEKQAAKIISEARNSIALTFVRADELLRMRSNILRLTTGSKSLDSLIGGGVETWAITEFYGEYGTGKSQLCHQLSVNVQLPPERGGLSGGALYIDTENTFRPERIAQMARHLGLDPEEVMKNIVYAEAYNSLPFNESVIITNDGEYHKVPIGDIVENRAQCNIHTFAFDPEKGEINEYPVTKLIKHKVSRGSFYTIRTEYGREITVTGSHSLFLGIREPYPHLRRRGNMRPYAFPANLLNIGDRIAIPRKMPLPEKDIERFDLACGLLSVSTEVQVSDMEVALKPTGRHVAVVLPRFIDVDSDLLWLLGFFLAEGSYTVVKQGRVGGIRLTSDPTFLDKAGLIIKRKFPNVHVQIKGNSLSVRSRLLALVFERSFGFPPTARGMKARDKRIPEWIFALPLEKVKHFIKGYWDGDGYHTNPPPGRIILRMSSKLLAEDFALLLLRFGVVASIYPLKGLKHNPNRRQPYRVEAAGLSSNDPLNLDRISQRLHAPSFGDIVFAKIKSIEEHSITQPTVVYDFEVYPNGKPIQNFIGGFGGVCCHNSDHQMLLLEKADKWIKENNIRLIIIDSLTAHFRSEYLGREMLAERQQKLNKHMHRLINLARAFNAVAIVTNQVMAKPDVFFGEAVSAVGGHIVAHTSHTRIFIRKTQSGPVRIARLVSSPYLPEGETVFKVTENGIEDITENDEVKRRPWR
jgi:RecA/RadA recombinase/intein/homing endonuclease